MKRQVGKYTISCPEQEITTENHYQYTVTIVTQNSFRITFFGSELFLYQIRRLRYSNSESEITETLKEIIIDKEDMIGKLKNIIEEN